MKKTRLYQRFWGLGILILLLAVGVVVQQVLAKPEAEPALQISPLHPTFALLDSQGVSVLESGAAVSTMQTCGQCHDTAYIASNSFHVDLGQSQQTAPGGVEGGMPWETSTGLYGGWDPLTYRYLSPAGDAQADLNTADWVAFNAERLVGGGPAVASGVEMNCFLCHLQQPNDAERVAVIQSGQGQWASTATLLGTGIVERSGEQYAWNLAAFTADGELDSNFVNIQDPTNANCAQCHGLAQDGGAEPLVLAGCSLDNWQTATTGQVISGERISNSGMNIAGKGSLTRSWDIHAERGLQCTDCHFSLNNPAYYQTEDAPSHLEYDPRRIEIGSYLEKPNHNFARGQSAQYTIAPELKGTMRRCESCHNTNSHADWLPYVDRHMQEVACETCHTPQMNAGAVQSYDWTVLTADGQPASQCRGVEGDTGTIADLVTGFQPVALQRTNVDGDTMLAPYNLITSWYWVYDSADGPRPVSLDDLQAAWLDGSGYAAAVLQAFDADRDGLLSEMELRLDTPEKQALIAGRLAALGLANPHIEGVVQPYSINHNVTRGKWAVSDCQTCHSDDSRLAEPMVLAAYVPGGVLPAFAADTNTLVSNELTLTDGVLVYTPDLSEAGLYVFGHNRVSWVDWLGGLFFVGVLLAVAGHSGLRAYSSLRRPKGQAALKRVYMYAVYERFWHWLQTFTIVLLLFTGLIIHRPDMFGFLSFRYMVTLHNILAVILVVNAGLSLFYHLVSGEIRQYIPRPYGFFDQAIVQARYYIRGIFKGDPHPFQKTLDMKLNPLQQLTYFGILNVLLPLQILTGALMWGVQKWPEIANLLGGLPFLAPFHSLVAWLFGAFIVAHVYLTTTGYKPLTGIKAMMYGWEDMEDHEAHEAQAEAQIAEDSQPGAAAATE